MGEIFNSYSRDITTQAGGAVNSNQRNFFSKGSINAFGNKIRIQIKGHDTQDCTISGCSIGPANASYNFLSAPTRITFNSGSGSAAQPHAETIWSDWIDYDFSPATDHCIHIAYTSGSIYVSYGTGYTGNARCYRDYGTDDTLTQTLSGYSAGDGNTISVVGIQVEATDDAKKRYRLLIYDNDGGSGYFSLSELALKISGVNQCSGGYPRSMPHYSNWSSCYAFDSSSSTNWAVPLVKPTLLEYEFASALDIDAYSITSRNDADWNQSPASWILAYWDGSKWILVDYQSAQTSWTAGQTRSFSLPATVPMMVSNVVGYAVLSTIQPALNVSKIIGYAVLGPYEAPESTGGPMMWIF